MVKTHCQSNKSYREAAAEHRYLLEMHSEINDVPCGGKMEALVRIDCFILTVLSIAQV